MSNSFNISVKPEVAAVKAVVDANSVILIDVHNTDLPAAVTKIDANKTELDFIRSTDIPGTNSKVDYNKTVIDDIHDTDLPAVIPEIDANYALISDVHEYQTDRVFASDDLLLSADTERTKSGAGYVKVKEFLVALSGVYRISFDLKTSVAPYMVKGHIYKNDVAYGTLQSNTSTSYVTKTEDLAFAIGDAISLYIQGDDPDYTCYTRNCRIYGAYSEVVAQVITD